MSYSSIDTNLGSNAISIKLTPSILLDKKPVQLSYDRKSECDCGGDADCKLCEGRRIKIDEMTITVPWTSYTKGTQIRLEDGGDVDRYGRVQPLFINIKYDLPNGMRFINGKVEYSITLTDVAFGEMLSLEGDRFEILIPG